MNHETAWNKILDLLEHTRYPEEGQEAFLFGGGLCGTLSIPMLKPELNLIGVCDNDKGKQGTQIMGLPCLPPQALAQHENPFVLVSSNKNYQSIHAELLSRKVPHCNMEAYAVHRNLKEFCEMYESLDGESQRVYAGVLYCRLLGDSSGIGQYCTDQQYFCFPKFRYIGSGDVYIDCGAFAGDVVQKVVENSLGVFRRIYAFEPNSKTYAALKKRSAFLRDIWALDEGQIICEQKGVGGAHGFAAMLENPSNQANAYISPAGSSQGGIEIIALDDYIAQHQIEKTTFIKADIEGFEWDMLHGAAQAIQRDKPNLAICIYHSIFDYVRIYRYLKELVPEYRFAVRHHWNSFDETVLYCYAG